MAAFEVGGKTGTFTAATSAPTAVQVSSNNAEQSPQYLITNTGTVDVWLGWGQTAAQAAAAAVIPTSTQTFGCWVLARTQVVLSGPPGFFFTGITSSSTAVVYVTPGQGD